MEPSVVRKLLPELEAVCPMFKDVDIRCGHDEEGGKNCFRANALIVAALSPMLAEALDLDEFGDVVTILVPEGLTAEDLDLFFKSVFDWNFGKTLNEQSFESVNKVFDIFSINFSFENYGSNEIFEESSSFVNEVDAKSFKCDDCEATFSSPKLLRRHARTIHAGDHPYVCQLCGRRCRGPAGYLL